MDAPAAGLALRRGLRRRCPRCGERRIFDGWFHLKERCPNCGVRFQREAGSFTGTYLVNFAVTESLMFAVLMGYVLWRGITGNDAPIWPFLLGIGTFAIVAPIAFYPVAASTWVAMDLLMRPLDPDELADAEVHKRS